MNQKLTVIIPYFKSRYLAAALESLALQTDKSFEVFVGDDASHEDPSEIIHKYQTRLKITYQRFTENLGSHSLVAQWNRCVRKTSSEWVWLFSDDDETSPNCVAMFRKTLIDSEGKFDVYRFNTRIINGANQTVHEPPNHPEEETGQDFLFAKFSGWRSSFGVEYIFKRSAFDQVGGFVNFPLGWCSDDASWLAFSRQTGIRTIPDAKVFWRLSDSNISARKPQLVGVKLKAFRLYLLWLRREFPDALIQQRLRTEVGKWFPEQVFHWGGRPAFWVGIPFWCFFSRFTHKADMRLLHMLVNYTQIPGFGRLKRLLRK